MLFVLGVSLQKSTWSDLALIMGEPVAVVVI